ncbi:Tpk1p [Rhizophagus irregularis DAOM 197198w]|uniref:Tpk1p n=1 Tax=Rhizophagus irregularis (strain DAOM 197198w) TaxID=1432141 RepID=A0A015IMQ4_RHIIW|nr:Tpk1p [Rhizophagus irregularis DAOM 197198w]
MDLCEECNQNNTGYEWCRACNAKHFQRNFKNWTSGNANIDKFIRDTQLSASHQQNVLEWIPYNTFYDIKYIAKGGFGQVYRANWIDGCIYKRNNKNQNWDRYSNITVALKILNNSKDVTWEFINEIISHYKIGDNYNCYNCVTQLYGISQDPETQNYIMVLEYAEHGSLRNYLDKCYDKLSWKDKLNNLWWISFGLAIVHVKELIHRDLHNGNILKFSSKTNITDMGLCRPAYYNKLDNKIYGVLPYIAPEILRGQNYTKATDVYSFGIIMYEVISGLPPYHDVSHDESLAIKICLGLRPRFNIKVPQLIVHLIKKCLDANPLNRPIVNEIANILSLWYTDFDSYIELKQQIKESEEINNKTLGNSFISPTSSSLSYETHSEAIYTSRLLNFNNLPEPRNSGDYYNRYDDIISKEYSGN